MSKVIIVYAIIQLLTTAFGLSVIESVKPVVKTKLASDGYVVKSKNSLYEFNDKISKVLMGFIPGYYFIKALSLIGDKKVVDKQAKAEIENGNYIRESEVPEVQVIDEELKSDIKLNPETSIIFEKPEKYKAKKNDVSLYNTYETPIEYITREISKEEEKDFNISPFDSADKVVQHVVVKSEVTNADISRAISNLSVEELDDLANKIVSLADYKKRKKDEYKLEKEVA